MTEPRLGLPDLGIGVGLRVPHYRTILSQRPHVDFFEIINENFMLDGGKPLYHLERVLEHYRVIQHGVALGIGGPDALDTVYLERLKQLTRRVQPAWCSDHFCWTGTREQHSHDLLPLPYTQAMVRRVVQRARHVQDHLGVRFALENTSSYLAYQRSDLTEWQFISEIAEQADIGLLLDVNNVYVSAYNHGFDAFEFIRNLPHHRIVQIHLAGHTNLGSHIIDTHNGEVIEPVWQLYRAAIELAGPVSTLIEWDDEIPNFDVLLALVEHTRAVREQGLRAHAQRQLSGTSPELSFVAGRQLIPQPTPALTTAAAWLQGGPREHAAALGESFSQQAEGLQEQT